jgi:hypothetical protein
MYEEEREWRELYRSLIERVRADPGVTAAADCRTFVVVPIGLTAIAILASLVPAHRAASTDPTQSLRSE